MSPSLPIFGLCTRSHACNPNVLSTTGVLLIVDTTFPLHACHHVHMRFLAGQARREVVT